MLTILCDIFNRAASKRHQMQINNHISCGSGVKDMPASHVIEVPETHIDSTPERSIWELVADYAQNSSMHCVRYMFDRRRHWTESLLWVLVFGVSVYSCSDLISKAIDKWHHSSVIISFSERTTPVLEIPFPAVTICPETKAMSTVLNSKQFDMLQRANESDLMTDWAYIHMMLMQQVCILDIYDLNATNPTFDDAASTVNIMQKLREIAPKINSTMFRCTYRSYDLPCKDLFSEVMTDVGLCFSFNMLNSRELYSDNISDDFHVGQHNRSVSTWTLETGYALLQSEDPVDFDSYPFRIFGSGDRAGLQMTMVQSEADFFCRGPVLGYRVLLHSPDETPQMSVNYVQLSVDSKVLVGVRPNVMKTSNRLRSYAPNLRQCYFEKERQLQFYRVYKQRNCELECMANFTLRVCGCVKFSMPREQKTRVCQTSQIQCYLAAENEMQKLEYINGLSGRSAELGCNCLPECASLAYDVVYDSQARISWKELGEKINVTVEDVVPSVMSIFMKDKRFMAMRRGELYGWMELLANCGGLIGLFLGMSVLSIVEVVYYCTLRIFWTIRLRP